MALRQGTDRKAKHIDTFMEKSFHHYCLPTALLFTLLALAQTFTGPTMPVSADSISNSQKSLKELSFMRGTWSGKSESGAYVEESWSGPQDDSMVGHCRFIKNGKTTFLELLEIVNTSAGVVLRMRHFDGDFKPWDEKDEAGDCLFVSTTANEAVFDNNKKEHRVKATYRKTGAKSLYAAVEDSRDGKTSTYPFKYNLVE
jgi:Domain of unknown function (DUF6265)